MTDSALRTPSAKAVSDLSQALVLVTRKLATSRGASAAEEISADRLRNDLVSLGNALSQQSTRLGVACKPPVSGKPTHEAIQSVVKAMSELCSKAAFAAGKLGSSFMAKELRWASTDVLEAVQNLTSAVAASLRKSAAIPQAERDRHLQLIGVVWRSTEKLSQCSASEAEALSKALANEVEVMQDGLDEARDLLDATGSIQSDTESDDEDAESLTELERRRVENAIRLLLSAKRLVKRIIMLLKRSPLPLVNGRSDDLARVHSIVSSLVASQDELVSTLPGPQDVDELRTYAQAMLKDAQALANLAVELWPPDPGRPDIDSLISDLTLDTASDTSISLAVFPDQLADVEKELAVVL